MKGYWLDFPKKEITERMNEALCYDFPFDQEVAKPLFDAGLRVGNLTERPHFIDKRPFRANCNMFTLLLQGAMTVIVDDKTHHLTPGDLAYYCPTTTVHQTVEDCGSWWMYLYFFDVELWKPMHQRGHYIRPYESADRLFLLYKKISAARKTRSIGDIMHAREDAATMVALLKREIPSSRRKPDGRSVKLKELVARIAAEPQAQWTVDAMAGQLNLSSRQLTRLFQREYGTAPIEMVIKHRLMAASRLLTTSNRTLESIAYELNYSSVYTFSALFKKHIGVSPTEFRQAYWDQHSASSG